VDRARRRARRGAAYDPTTRTLRLSRIFAWFEEDFADRGGVAAYVLPYLPETLRSRLGARPDAIRIAHFDYDWRLNDLARAETRE
jgi:hypothetical protein